MNIYICVGLSLIMDIAGWSF